MNKMSITRTLVAVGAIAGFIALAVSTAVWAETEVCQVIRIKQEKGAAGSRIEALPQAVKIPKGTCVIWVNWVPERQIRVTFKESAKACMRATDAPSGFKEVENCYLSEFIPLGKTISLHFNEAGTYKYHIEVPDTTKSTPAGINPGKIEGTGEIHVE
jgi:plastocyanin